MHLVQRRLVHGRRRTGHQIGRALGFGKRDHFANGILAGQDHHHPVHTEGDAPVRGGAVLEGVQEKPKTVSGGRRRDA